MGREIGSQQRRVLALAGRFRGVPVALVAELLSVKERRARKVVMSLVDRGQLVVVNDPWTGQRRAWTPDSHAHWVRAQRQADADRATALLWPPIRTGSQTKAAR